jgi:hypothetical protein
MKISIMAYEGLYEIDQYGTVYSLGNDKTRKPRILKNRMRNGYLHIMLYKNCKGQQHKIHRLVAEHFIENDNPDVNDVVHHIDNNPLNNDLSNLEWVTQLENTQGKNCLTPKNNKSGYCCVSYNNCRKRWSYRTQEYGILHSKEFYTKAEAIEYKINYEK